MGYIANAKFKERLVRHYAELLDFWKKGEIYTPLIPLMGIEAVEPHPTKHYTKPLIVLTDSQDYSCADFFPAILMDNDRAVIFGTGTAGAGGAISKSSYPNRLGIAVYSYTTTLAIRPNLQPIENLGVTPHITYSSGPEDILNGRRGYANALIRTIRDLIGKTK